MGIVQKRLADLAVAALPVKAFATPFTIPPIEETMFWDARHDADLAHHWLRGFLAAEAARLADGGPVTPTPCWTKRPLTTQAFARMAAA